MKKRGLSDNSFLMLGILILAGAYFLPGNLSGNVVSESESFDPGQGLVEIPEGYERWIIPASKEQEAVSRKCIVRYRLTSGDEGLFGFETEVQEISVACPKNVGQKIEGSRPDRIFTLADVQSNRQINLGEVWESNFTGAGVIVAVVDTGVDYTHPDLSDSIIGGMGFGYPDFYDDYNHGTFVAGTITANGKINSSIVGVAPDAGIWVARVCSKPPIVCFESDISAAIEYIVRGPDKKFRTGDEPANIISMSLSSDWSDSKWKDRQCDAPLARKVNWAFRHGVLSVIAVGNYEWTVTVPGCAKSAIGVGAVYKSLDPDSWEERVYYSGTGYALDIMAPTYVGTTSAGGGYENVGGTSLATPHVAGVVALLKQAFPCLDNDVLRVALYKTAKDLGDKGFDPYYGHGRVDASAAYNYLLKKGYKCK
ncbi:S8 family serine peptidase [Candidatus Woesearchaeota archaeon]|nr:S8 family serine peptidase [Candidatus Woesearchaeota archaeon]